MLSVLSDATPCTSCALCPALVDVQIGGVKTLAHLAFGNDVNRIEVRARGTFSCVVYGVCRV